MTTTGVRRILPADDPATRFFWTSGHDGRLRFLQCAECSYFIHPPVRFCPQCEGRVATPSPVSGLGTVYSFTVNHQPWDGSGDPYVIAVVELDEQPDLRLLTNVVDVDPNAVRIGLRVEVSFEEQADVHLPLFRPLR